MLDAPLELLIGIAVVKGVLASLIATIMVSLILWITS